MKRKKIGQGMVEYIVIVGLIAVSSVWVASATSNYIKIGFAKIAFGLKGEKKQGGTYQTIDDKVTQGRNMNDFNEGVDK